MEFNCKVKIVDAIMGAGKSQSIINLINNSDEDDRFLVITSYLDEVKRYRDSCPHQGIDKQSSYLSMLNI